MLYDKLEIRPLLRRYHHCLHMALGKEDETTATGHAEFQICVTRPELAIFHVLTTITGMYGRKHIIQYDQQICVLYISPPIGHHVAKACFSLALPKSRPNYELLFQK